MTDRSVGLAGPGEPRRPEVVNVVDERSRNRMLAVLFVGVLMGALDIAIVGPALPAIQAGLGVGSRAIAWIFTIYVLFNLISTPLMAKLSDRFGRRSIYLLDVALFGLGSLVVAASPSFSVLLVGRAVQAIGSGGIFPVASAVIGDTFPADRRGRALGLIGAVFGVAFLLGPLLGGLLLQLSWHWLFLINIPVAAWLIVAASRLLPSKRPARSAPFDWRGTATLSALLAALALGVNHIDSAQLGSSLLSGRVLPYLLGALVLVPVFWALELGAADPLVRPGLLRRRQVALVGAFALGTGLAETSLVFLPSLAVSALHVRAATASFLLLPVVVLSGIGAPIAGRLLDALGAKPVIQSGLALTALGLVLFDLTGSSLIFFILAGALVGLGLSSLLGAPLRYVMLEEAGESERGAAQGVLKVFSGSGQLLGGALVGAVAASQGGGAQGYRTALLVIGLVTAALAILSFAMRGRVTAEAPASSRSASTPSSASD
ncbi:MAG TPA: MFS transporter [Trueperaceae bacterium]|nr:MFS transporter [Trueperaceae bacterium]